MTIYIDKVGRRVQRVRVLLAISDDGAYIAEGYDDTKPKQLQEQVLEMVMEQRWSPPIELRWIEADVLVPDPIRPHRLAAQFISVKGASRPARKSRRPVMARKAKGKKQR